MASSLIAISDGVLEKDGIWYWDIWDSIMLNDNVSIQVPLSASLRIFMSFMRFCFQTTNRARKFAQLPNDFLCLRDSNFPNFLTRS
jgi:hypothetical protein